MSFPLLVLILAAYLVGSIPFGLLVGKLKGIDVRKAGSGNIGATNVGRLLGRRWFFLVFTLDAAKGLLPMLLGARLVDTHSPDPTQYILWMLAGLAVLLGHMFPLYLGFKGGKGVATSLGVMFGVFPYYFLAALPAVAVFLLTFTLTRIISISSILGAIAFPVFLALIGLLPFSYFGLPWHLFTYQSPLLIFATAMAALVVYRHRANIARLRAGTEPKFVKKAPPPAAA